MQSFLMTFLLFFTVNTMTFAEEVADPFEEVNRVTHEFNQGLDENVFEPVAKAYKKSVPETVQNRVSDFSSNLSDISTFGNQLLQFKLFESLNTLGRVVTNSTIGLGGLFDVASDMGMQKESEDFGQTMAVWGTPSGPYVVLPIVGPSNLRDVTGTYVDVSKNFKPTKQLSNTQKNTLIVVRGIDTRVGLLSATKLLKNADDHYIATRSSYNQNRKFDIFDGNPPVENDGF